MDAAPAEVMADEAPGGTIAEERATWEREKGQLRVRIANLLAENKALRFQIGQLQQQSYGDGMSMHGADTRGATARDGQSR